MGDPSRYHQPPPSSQGSAALLSAMAGAVLGAAGVAWWLLSEAERRRLNQQRQRLQRLTRHGDQPGTVPQVDLHDKVHQLNQAIEDVRRQLESLSPQG